MASIQYGSSSPYNLTPQTSWYLGQYVHKTIPSQSSDVPFVVTKAYEFRPDLLSQTYYGKPDYWWTFIARNRNVMKDPIWDLKSGVTIMIPTAATISKYVG